MPVFPLLVSVWGHSGCGLHFKRTNKMPEACDDNLRAAFKQSVTCRKSSVTITNKHIFNILLFWLKPNGKYFGFRLPTIEIRKLRFTTVAVWHMAATVSACVPWTQTIYRLPKAEISKQHVLQTENRFFFSFKINLKSGECDPKMAKPFIITALANSAVGVSGHNSTPWRFICVEVALSICTKHSSNVDFLTGG